MRSLARTIAGLTATALAVAAAVAAVATPAGAASAWDLDYSAGSAPITTFGRPNTATYGETFVVPEGPERLESFSFRLRQPAEAVFRAVVQPWDPTARHATGEPLYTSGPLSTTSADTETVTVSPDIAITPGTYVAYFTISYDYDAQPETRGAWVLSDAAYPDGDFVYLNNGAAPEWLTTTPWSTWAQDLAFTVTFAAPPVVPPTTPPVTPPVTAPPVEPTPAPTTPPAVAPTTTAATPVVAAPAYTG